MTEVLEDWLVLLLLNTVEDDKTYLIVVNDPLFNDVQFYIIKGREVVVFVEGV